MSLHISIRFAFSSVILIFEFHTWLCCVSPFRDFIVFLLSAIFPPEKSVCHIIPDVIRYVTLSFISCPPLFVIFPIILSRQTMFYFSSDFLSLTNELLLIFVAILNLICVQLHIISVPYNKAILFSHTLVHIAYILHILHRTYLKKNLQLISRVFSTCPRTPEGVSAASLVVLKILLQPRGSVCG